MNKIEKMILDQGKKIILKYALAEIADYRERLEKTTDTVLIDILNTGLLLDIRKAQRRGLEIIETKLLQQKKEKAARKKPE
jgi:hypothetical protein